MTLYRKYRPQSFADFVNQKPIKITIQNQIAHGKMTHAYLFTGPRGVGKTTMARLIAKALNCENRTEATFEPCNRCVSCEEIVKGNSLDLEEKDAASNRGIDEIRTLKDTVRFSPTTARYKIYIIDEVHMLTTPAFNALLKTLEEPPSHVIFVLATTEPHKLPDTIISRCQRFDFKKVPQDEIVAMLQKIIDAEGITVDRDILKNIALRSEGCLRDALSLLGQIVTLGVSREDKKITWEEAALVIPRSNSLLAKELIDHMRHGAVQEAFSVIHKLVEEGIDIRQFMLDVIGLLRTTLLERLNDPVQSQRQVRVIDVFLKRLEDIKRTSFLPHLPLELAVLDSMDEEPGEHAQSQNENKAQSIIAPVARDQKAAPRASSSSKTEEIQAPQESSVSQPDETRSQNHVSREGKNSPTVTDHAKARSLASSPHEGPMNLETIIDKWDVIQNVAKEYNHSLPVALSLCKPLRLEGNTLILGFKFKLHQKQVHDDKNRSALETVLKQVFNQEILVEPRVVEDLAVDESHTAGRDDTDRLLNAVRDVFEIEEEK